MRDDAIRAAGASERLALSRIRNQADRLIALFGLELLIHKPAIEEIIRERCQEIAETGNLPVLRDGWSKMQPPAKWAKVFDVESWKTIKRRIDRGEYQAIKVDEKNWRIHLSHVPEAKIEEVT